MDTVFAVFRAEILIVDAAKRASLHRMLLDLITATATDEKLDEKLASMTLREAGSECKQYMRNSFLRFVVDFAFLGGI